MTMIADRGEADEFDLIAASSRSCIRAAAARPASTIASHSAWGNDSARIDSTSRPKSADAFTLENSFSSRLWS